MLLKFRSSIKPELLKKTLFRGTMLGGIGIGILIIAALVLPLHILEIWGFPILVCGLLLIAIDLIPYRRLSQLELSPYELHFNGKTLIFFKKGDALFEIDIHSIESLEYVEKNQIYGWKIRLKRPIENKIRVVAPRAQFETFYSRYLQKIEDCDLFLPYFSKRSFDELKDSL